MNKNEARPRVPEMQADALLNQTNPVSGTKYEVLAETKNVRILSISISVTWTVQPTPLEVHLTIDGIEMNFSKVNPVSTTNYYAHKKSNTVKAVNAMALDASEDWYSAFLLEGRTIKVEAETTGGTVSNLTCRVRYAKW